MTDKEKKIFLTVVITNTILLFTFIIVLLLLSSKGINEASIKTELITETKKEFVYENYLTRFEINDILKKDIDFYLIALGFYNEETKNPEVTKKIIDNAIEFEIPINIAFALAFVESTYNINAINDNGTSIDFGLLQLNNKTFPNAINYTIEQNIEEGFNYLKNIKEEFNSWEISFILYNAGLIKNVGNHSLQHMKKIIEKEKELDEKFNIFRRSINQR